MAASMTLWAAQRLQEISGTAQKVPEIALGGCFAKAEEAEIPDTH